MLRDLILVVSAFVASVTKLSFASVSEIMKATVVTKSSIHYILKKFTVWYILSGKLTGRPRKLTKSRKKGLFLVEK